MRAEVLADRIAVLDADERDLAARRVDPARVGGGQRQADLVRRDLLGQAVDRVELLDRRLVGAVVAGRRERIRAGALADVDDEEGGVEAALDHLGQVHLVAQVHRVVALGGEVRGADVVVRVERHHALVDPARLRRQRVVLREQAGWPRQRQPPLITAQTCLICRLQLRGHHSPVAGGSVTKCDGGTRVSRSPPRGVLQDRIAATVFETLFQFLFEYRPHVFRQGDFRFAPPAGAPVAAVVVIAALAMAFISYRVLRVARAVARARGARRAARRRARPSSSSASSVRCWSSRRRSRSRTSSACCIDDSRSMQLPDDDGRTAIARRPRAHRRSAIPTAR